MKTTFSFFYLLCSYFCFSQTYSDEILGPITQEQYDAIYLFEEDCREAHQLLCDFRTLCREYPESRFLFGSSKESHIRARIESFLQAQEKLILENKISEFENNRCLYLYYYKPNIEHKISYLLMNLDQTHLPQR